MKETEAPSTSWWQDIRAAAKRRRELRRDLRRRVRQLSIADDSEAGDPQEEIERLERLHELTGRWLATPTSFAVIAVGFVLALALVMATVRSPWSTARISLSGIATEFAVQAVSPVDVPRIAGIEELHVTGLSEVMGEDGRSMPLQALHLRAEEGGRIVVESFDVTSGSVWWRLDAEETSISWRPGGTSSASIEPLILAVRGPIESAVTSRERREVRRLEIRPDSSSELRLTWRRADAGRLEIPPFRVKSLDFLRTHPNASGNLTVSGWVRGEITVPARSVEPVPLGFRERLKTEVRDGRVVGLRSTAEGWQLRFDGDVASLFIGPNKERNLFPTIFQQVNSEPWVRNAFAVFTLVLSGISIIWGFAWR